MIEIIVAILLLLGISCGFLLFRKNMLSHSSNIDDINVKLSVIIPARNEEQSLPNLLSSLQNQNMKIYEIIVVNDGSTDRTKDIAQHYGVTVIDNTPPPPGWTGKTWAVWNGYLHSTGDVLAFIDADIVLSPEALRVLLIKQREVGGVLSIIPFHRTYKFYERLAMITNILGTFVFTSPFEKYNPRKGLYGPLIIAKREDYELIDGHRSIRGEIVDDLRLGEQFIQAGIATHNFLGVPFVSYRMYPQGIIQEIQGFSKSAILSTATVQPITTFCIALWVLGLIISELWIFFIYTRWFFPLLMGYVAYALQLMYLNRYKGNFGYAIPLLHICSTLFFLLMMGYSAYQVVGKRQVVWKGRHISIGRKQDE